MNPPRITSQEYQELLDGEDSPALRSEYQRLKARAEKREDLLARISEKARREMIVHKWQQDSLRELRKLFAECYEVTAWMSREHRPPLAPEAQNRLYPKLRGMHQRFSKARREASAGCPMQTKWLADHSEIIAEVESFSAQK